MLTVLSLSHRHSTLAERARFGLGEEDQTRLYRVIRSSCGGQVLFLSTCNRVEMVIWGSTARQEQATAMARPIGQRLFPGLAQAFLHRAIVLYHQSAATHVMRVAGGLESQAVGDVQVLGQVRTAYLRASRAGSIGPELHRLFQTTLQTGKRIHRETDFGVAAASVGRVAAGELLNRLTTSPSPGYRIAVIGAGQTGTAAAAELVRRGARVVILNRSPERSASLAARLGAATARFEARHAELAVADGAIIATGSTESIISTTILREERARCQRQDLPLQVFDLSVPGNTEPALALLPGVRRMTIEDLPRTESDAAEAAANVIVAEGVARFHQWLSTRPSWREVA